jgi:hypothetical protein
MRDIPLDCGIERRDCDRRQHRFAGSRRPKAIRECSLGRLAGCSIGLALDPSTDSQSVEMLQLGVLGHAPGRGPRDLDAKRELLADPDNRRLDLGVELEAADTSQKIGRAVQQWQSLDCDTAGRLRPEPLRFWAWIEGMTSVPGRVATTRNLATKRLSASTIVPIPVTLNGCTSVPIDQTRAPSTFGGSILGRGPDAITMAHNSNP